MVKKTFSKETVLTSLTMDTWMCWRRYTNIPGNAKGHTCSLNQALTKPLPPHHYCYCESESIPCRPECSVSMAKEKEA